MLRKRAEHNDGELTSLEEITLHQFEIEKIELLETYCRNLKILFLQNNQIQTIENVGKLKKLEYLNLALNNVKVIQVLNAGLRGCESLKKLDLTVNFIKNLSFVEHLKDNYELRELFLLGNPATDFPKYRLFVIASLPQLTTLDGKLIEKSERIIANQEYERIVKDLAAYNKEKGYDIEEEIVEERDLEKLGKIEGDKKLPCTPETRLAIAKEYEKLKEEKEKRLDKKSTIKPERVLERDGKIIQMNEGKYPFQLMHSDDDLQPNIILQVEISKYLDTSYIKVDVNTNYVRVEIKGKMLQIRLEEGNEIRADESKVQRSQVTGELIIVMPKVHYVQGKENRKIIQLTKQEPKKEKIVAVPTIQKNIKDFVDNPEVPPLE